MKRVLFVCVHNAGRSQMAEAFLNGIASAHGLSMHGLSAGTVGGSLLNQAAVAVMREAGFDMSAQRPKILSSEMVTEADRIITMGCGVDAEACPAKFFVTEDWGLDDPAGQPIEKVREIRDEIEARVRRLIEELK